MFRLLLPPLLPPLLLLLLLLLRVIQRCANTAAGPSPACCAFIYYLQVEGFMLKLEQLHLNVSRRQHTQHLATTAHALNNAQTAKGAAKRTVKQSFIQGVTHLFAAAHGQTHSG